MLEFPETKKLIVHGAKHTTLNGFLHKNAKLYIKGVLKNESHEESEK